MSNKRFKCFDSYSNQSVQLLNKFKNSLSYREKGLNEMKVKLKLITLTTDK